MDICKSTSHVSSTATLGYGVTGCTGGGTGTGAGVSRGEAGSMVKSTQFQNCSPPVFPVGSGGFGQGPVLLGFQPEGHGYDSYPSLRQLLPVIHHHCIKTFSPNTPSGSLNFIRCSNTNGFTYPRLGKFTSFGALASAP